MYLYMYICKQDKNVWGGSRHSSGRRGMDWQRGEKGLETLVSPSVNKTSVLLEKLILR